MRAGISFPGLRLSSNANTGQVDISRLISSFCLATDEARFVSAPSLNQPKYKIKKKTKDQKIARSVCGTASLAF